MRPVIEISCKIRLYVTQMQLNLDYIVIKLWLSQPYKRVITTFSRNIIVLVLEEEFLYGKKYHRKILEDGGPI